MLQHGREIAPSVSWDILAHVKRTGGISVNELASLLKMSYMGVKQHCDALKRRGYLDTWRRPKTTGRPEKIFRPTVKLDLVLPNWGNEMCLNMLAFSAQMQGETAPERLLHSFLQQKAELWAAKMKAKSLQERAQQFAKLRNADGWMCEVIQDENGISIAEYHSPLKEIARLYPAVWTLELRALERCFGGPLSRTDAAGASYLHLSKTSEEHAEAVTSPVETVTAAPAAKKQQQSAVQAAPKAMVEPEPEPATVAAVAPQPTPEQTPLVEIDVTTNEPEAVVEVDVQVKEAPVAAAPPESTSELKAIAPEVVHKAAEESHSAHEDDLPMMESFLLETEEVVFKTKPKSKSSAKEPAFKQAPPVTPVEPKKAESQLQQPPAAAPLPEPPPAPPAQSQPPATEKKSQDLLFDF